MTRLLAVVAAILIAAGIIYYLAGREDRLKDEINRRDTLERMDNATNPDLDDDGILDSLRDHAKP